MYKYVYIYNKLKKLFLKFVNFNLLVFVENYIELNIFYINYISLKKIIKKSIFISCSLFFYLICTVRFIFSSVQDTFIYDVIRIDY